MTNRIGWWIGTASGLTLMLGLLGQATPGLEESAQGKPSAANNPWEVALGEKRGDKNSPDWTNHIASHPSPELFTASPSAIQGKTRDGKTILEAPPFTTPARTDLLEYYPCSDCHEEEPVNPRERVLVDEHEDLALEHGGGRFWCLTCHGNPAGDRLVSLKGKPISFEAPYLLCGQCHFQRQKDWYFGGHGKRIGTWRDQRVINACPVCHNPHSPSIKPFTPKPPPPVRKGLVRKFSKPLHHIMGWEALKPP